MAIVVKNTNYNGVVLERILTVATTGNELVDKGLIMVIPGVEKKISVPRLKAGKTLQKRKEDPQKSDAQGDFNYSEQTLEPHDFMAFTVFNPRALSRYGESGSLRATWCLRNFLPRPRTLFWRRCRSRCSLSLATCL